MLVKLYREKIYILVFAFLLLPLGLVAQNKSKTKPIDSKKYGNQTIMNIGETAISFGEAKQIYEKNSMRNNTPFEAIPKDSAMNFLKLYAKYKMKVSDGIKNGYDKDTTIINEVERNKKVLAESFLLETELIEPQVRKYTQRRKVEKQIAIIICNHAASGDTVESYKNIMAALQEIKKGVSFEEVAKKYSSDSLSASTGGAVPLFITGMRLQRDVEEAIYSLKSGEVTQTPIKTDYGYFLIKLLKEQPRQFIGISHILIPLKNDNKDIGPVIADSVASKKLADSLYDAINAGANFNEVAKKFSSDKANSNQGGMLGVYSRSTGIHGSGESLVPSVEAAAFSLKDKQIAKPVLTNYGYHIVRRDSTVKFPDDFEYSELKSNYSRMFLPEDRQLYFDSIAVNQCNFKIEQPVFDKLLSNIDTTKTVFDTSFVATLPADLLPETLYSINKINYSVKSFVDNATTNPSYKITAANRTGLRDIIRKLIHPIIIDITTTDIHKTHPQFNTIVNDFSSGLVLFKTEEENVWKKITFDTAFAKEFYDTTSLYMNLRRDKFLDISEIYMANKEQLIEVLNKIKSGEITFENAAGMHTQRKGFRERKGRMGPVNLSNVLAVYADSTGMKVDEISEPINMNIGWAVIKLHEIEQPRKMTFEEALPRISTAVQNEITKRLENEWNKKLENEYPVTYNDKLIKEIFKNK